MHHDSHHRSPMRFFLLSLAFLAATAFVAPLTLRGSSVQAGTARRMDVAGLVDGSDVAFQGRIVSKRARLGARNLIETEYVFQVDKTFWGEELETRVVKIPGGVLPDGRGLILAGMPKMEAGEEVLLFLSASSGRGLRMPVGLAQGKFTLQRLPNGAKRLVRDAQSLQLTNPATGEIEPAPPRSIHDYAGLTAEVLRAVSARKARIAAGREKQD